MIQLVGYLRRPVAADVTVEQVALDRLAQSRRAARAIGLPPGREYERAPDRNMRRLRQPIALQRYGACLVRLKRLDKAIAVFSRLVILDSANGNARQFFAVSF